MSDDKKIYARCAEHFKTHKAKIVLDTDRYLVIDWRKEDGSSEYYVNFVVDKQLGSLIVNGDLGRSIAVWGNPIEPSKLKDWIYSDIGYYIQKLSCGCASDLYYYTVDDVVADIKSRIEDDDACLNEAPDEYAEFWDNVETAVQKSLHNLHFIPDSELVNLLSEKDDNCYEWLSHCGERINKRVYFWAVGFYMACQQLGI